jgi:MFS family permease
MASVSVVLPFLLAQKGIFWAAGLLYPTFSIGFIAGNALSPLVVERSRRRQNVVIATAAATIAALTSCIAAVALRDVLVAPVFLLASLAIGCAMGMANNAYAEIISRMLDRRRRNHLLLNQEAVGAVLTVAATLLILPLPAGSGVLGDTRAPAAGGQHGPVVVAVPRPVQTVLGEGLVERRTLQFRGVGDRADGAEENC